MERIVACLSHCLLILPTYDGRRLTRSRRAGALSGKIREGAPAHIKEWGMVIFDAIIALMPVALAVWICVAFFSRKN